MKIKLQTAGDVHVLTVAGLDTPENFKVLRAGISQSLKSGKNKIIVDLSEPTTIPPEVLRELGRFRLLANELAGDIILSGLGTELRLKVESFSTPPFTVCFEKLEQALQHFKTPPKAAQPAAAPAAPSTPSPTAAPTPVQDAVKTAREKVQSEESGELGKLRKELERLKKENESLAKLLAKKFFDRREPEGVQDFQAQVKDLEDRLAEILEKPPEKPKPGQAKAT